MKLLTTITLLCLICFGFENIEIKPNEAIDINNLYGSWIPISIGGKIDTSITNHLKDTDKMVGHYSTIITFAGDGSNRFRYLFSDMEDGGTYKINCRDSEITLYNDAFHLFPFEKNTKGSDSLQVWKIVHLDKNYLLLDMVYQNTNYWYFLIKAAVKKSWIFDGGG